MRNTPDNLGEVSGEKLFSDAVTANGFVFTTGQMPLDDNWNLISEDFDLQAAFVFDRLNELLEHAGTSVKNLVKVTIYLSNIDDVPLLASHRQKFLGDARPASVIVQVGRFGVTGMRLEAAVIATSGLSNESS